jgi:hypothetical protein
MLAKLLGVHSATVRQIDAMEVDPKISIDEHLYHPSGIIEKNLLNHF